MKFHQYSIRILRTAHGDHQKNINEKNKHQIRAGYCKATIRYAYHTANEQLTNFFSILLCALNLISWLLDISSLFFQNRNSISWWCTLFFKFYCFSLCFVSSILFTLIVTDCILLLPLLRRCCFSIFRSMTNFRPFFSISRCCERGYTHTHFMRLLVNSRIMKNNFCMCHRGFRRPQRM